MEETFMNAVVEKLEQIEKRISSSTAEKSQIAAFQENQEGIAEEVNDLKTTLSSLNNEVKYFSQKLKDGIETLSRNSQHQTALIENPPKPENPLKRSFNNLLGGCILLTLFLALVIAMLIFNHQKLNKYVANDTKYRSLELINDKRLHQFLYLNDSTYKNNSEMRKIVIELEEKRDRKLELLREAKMKKEEADDLKKKTGRF